MVDLNVIGCLPVGTDGVKMTEQVAQSIAQLTRFSEDSTLHGHLFSLYLDSKAMYSSAVVAVGGIYTMSWPKRMLDDLNACK